MDHIINEQLRERMDKIRAELKNKYFGSQQNAFTLQKGARCSNEAILALIQEYQNSFETLRNSGTANSKFGRKLRANRKQPILICINQD